MTAAMFLVAAHIAFVRFQPMLSSRAMANTINAIADPQDTLILYGDQSYGSSIIFYTQRRAYVVNGCETTLLWGSDYPCGATDRASSFLFRPIIINTSKRC